MAKDHSDSKRGNPLPPLHGLLFLISSKAYICMYVRTYVCICMCVCIMYVYVCMYVCICMYICMCTYICTSMHVSYFSFQPVLHDSCKHRGMCYPVCGMVHIKEPLMSIEKSSPCGGSGFPLSLSEWSFTMSDAI